MSVCVHISVYIYLCTSLLGVIMAADSQVDPGFNPSSATHELHGMTLDNFARSSWSQFSPL